MNDAILLPRSSGRPRSCDGFLSEAVAGLSRPQKNAALQSFSTMREGSSYLTKSAGWRVLSQRRTENQILRDNIYEIASLIGNECRLVNLAAAQHQT